MSTKVASPAKIRRTIGLAENYKATFGSKQGKAVLLDLLQEHYMFSTTYGGPSDDDGRTMAYRDGQRSVVLRIMHTMGLDVGEMYMLLNQGADDVRKKDS